MTSDAPRLKSLAERINRLTDERDGIGADIRDVYLEAKSAGYVPKVLRKAIGRQRMDPSKRAEEDSILELYEGALDGRTRAVIAELRAGATFDATSEKTGTPRRTVARLAETVPKTSQSGTARELVDGDLGEWMESCGGVDGHQTKESVVTEGLGVRLGANECADRVPVEAVQSAQEREGRRPSSASILPSRLSTDLDDTAGIKPGPQDPSDFGATVRAKMEAAGLRIADSPIGPILTNAAPDDDLAFPDFLRRKQATA